MMRIVIMLSSLWLAVASAAPAVFEAGNQSGCFEDPSTEGVAATAGYSVGDSTVRETGPGDVTGEADDKSIEACFAGSASAPESDVDAGGVVTGCPEDFLNAADNCAAAYACAEAGGGETVTDHDISIFRSEDGTVSGFAESFAQASSEDGGRAKAVSKAVSVGGGTSSAIAIARAE